MDNPKTKTYDKGQFNELIRSYESLMRGKGQDECDTLSLVRELAKKDLEKAGIIGQELDKGGFIGYLDERINELKKMKHFEAEINIYKNLIDLEKIKEADYSKYDGEVKEAMKEYDILCLVRGKLNKNIKDMGKKHQDTTYSEGLLIHLDKKLEGLRKILPESKFKGLF